MSPGVHTLVAFVTCFILNYTCAENGIFEPEVSVRSCDEGKLTVTIHNATEGGIVYVQGARAACLHVISAQPDQYTFDIVGCKLDWNGQYTLVIQKKALYQTSDDRVITVRCIVDTNDIVVNGQVTIRDEVGEAAELVERPMASMRLFRESEDVTGSDVTLDDMLNLQIELDDEYRGMVDIKAKECHAGTIPLIRASCAVDSDLFSDFAHVVRGELSASFAAFRPTILNGGSFTLVLSCTLAVCRGHCPTSTCNREEEPEITQEFFREKRASNPHMHTKQHSDNSKSAEISADQIPNGESEQFRNMKIGEIRTIKREAIDRLENYEHIDPIIDRNTRGQRKTIGGGNSKINAIIGEIMRDKRAAVGENVTETIEVATVVRIIADDSLIEREKKTCITKGQIVGIVAICTLSFTMVGTIFVRFLKKFLRMRKIVDSKLERQESVTSSASVESTTSETASLQKVDRKKVSWDSNVDKKDENAEAANEANPTIKEIQSCGGKPKNARKLRRKNDSSGESNASTSASDVSRVGNSGDTGVSGNTIKIPARRMASIVAMIVDKNVATAMETLRKKNDA